MSNNKHTQVVDFSNPNADKIISASTQEQMSLDLNKLANKLDEALSNETSETLTKFLNDKRMTNIKQHHVGESNKMIGVVDWLEQEFLKLESTVGVQGVFYELLERAKPIERQPQKEFDDDLAF
jgi:hypothetical protein